METWSRRLSNPCLNFPPIGPETGCVVPYNTCSCLSCNGRKWFLRWEAGREPWRVREDDFQQEVGKWQDVWYPSALATLLDTMTKHLANATQRREGLSQLMTWDHLQRKGRQRGWHMNAEVQYGFSPFLHARTPLATSVEPPWKHPHRHMQRRISGIIPDLGKLTSSLLLAVTQTPCWHCPEHI